MSEYMEKHSVSKLIGSPPGYIGYESGGLLTESIRRKPYQVVLLDEIEKAHSEIYNILLQVFDEGRLTDSHGRTVNFKNTIIIMTSNIGAELINFSEEQKNKIEIFTQEKILEKVRQKFKPEFLNRVDEIIIFNRLSKQEMNKILKLQISEIVDFLKIKKIQIELDEKAENWLIDEGFSSSYGARPLKRVIQTHVIDKIAHMMISNEINEKSKVFISTKNSELDFKIKL